MGNFSADVNKFIKKAKTNQSRFLREFSFEIAKEIITHTPVKTGFLRGSWYASINDVGKTRKGKESKSGTFSLSGITLVLKDIKPEDTIYLLNNAKYARRIEYGFTGYDSLGRFYDQAPRGMVRRTLANAEGIANDVARRIASE